MTVPFFIPFINKPDVTGQIPVGITTAYTVPAGKYAKVNVMLSVVSYYSFSFQSGSNSLSTTDNVDGCRSESFSVWLKAGDVITISGTSAGSSNSVTFTGAASTGTSFTYPSSASVTITINGNPYTIQCYGKQVVFMPASTSGVYGVTNQSSSKSLIHYEEFIEPV
jgi:uncharacterized protein (TIGR03437 family)